MNTKRMIAVLAVLVMAFAAFAFIPAEENDAPPSAVTATPEEIVYLHGDVTSQLRQTEDQIVIVDADLNIKDGGSVSIAGKLIVNEGVTITIDAIRSYEGLGFSREGLSVTGDAEINGNIVSKSSHGLRITPGTGKEVIINGTVSALGNTSGTPVISAILEAEPAQTGSKDIIVNGAIIVGTNAEVEFTKVYFAKDATLTVLGIANGSIMTAGTVNFDGATDDPAKAMSDVLEIYIAQTSAVINVVSVEGTLKITDYKMYVYTYGGVQYYIGAVPSKIPTESGGVTVAAVAKKVSKLWDNPMTSNSITFKDISNIKITEIYYEDTGIYEDERIVRLTMMNLEPLDSQKTVSGSSDDAAISTGWTEAGYLANSVFFRTMTIQDISVTISDDSYAYIAGDVIYPLQSNPDKMMFKVEGSLNFENKNYTDETLSTLGILSILKSENGLVINNDTDAYVGAAHYTVKDIDNKVDHYYTTLKKAIDNGATEIDMLGAYDNFEDITIPAGVSVEFKPINVQEGYTMTIANGAKIDLNDNVNVFGTLVIENIDYGVKFNGYDPYADVLLKDGSYRMYTNISNAFANAKAGDEIEAYSSNPVCILDDLTLPAGVQFDNKGKRIFVSSEVTFTVAGKLVIDDDSKLITYASGGWNSEITKTVDGAVVDCSVIAIGPQGVIEISTLGGTFYSGHTVNGAYFTDEGKYYIANVELAFAGILDTSDKTVTLAGDVTLDNITVNGTEKERILIVIKQGSEVTMKNFTFSYGKVVVERSLYDITGPELKMNDPTILTGDIGTSSGKMIFDNAVIFDPVVFDYQFIDDSMNLVVRGIDKENKDKEAYFDNAATKAAYVKSDNPTSVSGTVYISLFKYFGTYEAKKDFTNMRFVVPAGAQLFVVGDSEVYDAELLIEGTMTVKYPGKIAAAIYSVLGTMNVEKIDGKSGEARIAYAMFVGGSTESFNDLDLNVNIQGSASVNGAGKFVFGPIVSGAPIEGMGVIGVFSGASVTADVLVDWIDNTAKSTEFYVNNSIWLTAYQAWAQAGAFAIDKIEPALSDVTFNGWQTYDEKSKTYTDVPKDTLVGAAGFDKVYADIDTVIYTINVNADQGIDNVYIDGVLMTKTVATNSYKADVAAGTHTLSYTLANGYSGNAYITSIDGKTLVGSALTFVANDEKAGDDRTMDITLSGIQKSGYDIDPETHEQKSTGLTVTEILLIVVVIIMAVMAIVLIMRLNRS